MDSEAAMKLRFWRTRSAVPHHVTHADAVAELHALERQKAHLDRYDENPNDGYSTPFNSTVYPGVDI